MKRSYLTENCYFSELTKPKNKTIIDQCMSLDIHWSFLIGVTEIRAKKIPVFMRSNIRAFIR